MDNINAITDLGLSEPEAHMYLELLKSGGVLASSAAKNAGVKRTTAYPILQSLSEKGLVTIFYRKNRRYFYPQKPEKVSQLFKHKLASFEAIIPLLSTLEKKQTTQFGLRFIETVEELKQFYGLILEEYRNKKYKEYQIIGNANAWEDLEPDFFVQFRKDRARAGIHTRLLLSSDSIPRSPTDDDLLRTVKFLPAQYKFKSTIDIFDDKVLVVSPKMTSLAVVIAVPAMVDVFASIFKVMWDAN